jgi:hypothetical protein
LIAGVGVGVLDVLEVVDGTGIEALWYISNLSEPPQYSNWFPGQANEQSVPAAATEPALSALPQ